MPTGGVKRNIADEADGRLAFYLQPPEDLSPNDGQPEVKKPQLPEGVFDAPLVRLYNFLRRSHYTRVYT
jgi:mediator of RNA polymerase II transcription subunit 14